MARRITVTQFSDIDRGTSLTIPCFFLRSDGSPIDMTGYQVFFTLKPFQYDYDYDDVRAYISKEVTLDEELAQKGRFNVCLSSKETWLTPGEYIFDIEVVKDHGVARIALCKTNIVGGPTNRTVDHEVGYSIAMSEALNITLDGEQAIVVQTPLVSDPPDNLVETLISDPEYILEDVSEKQNQRDYLIKGYGARAMFPMHIRVNHDAIEHRISFDRCFELHMLPAACPLRNGALVIKNRDLSFDLKRQLDARFYWNGAQHSPEITNDGGFTVGTTQDHFFIGDNVDCGNIQFSMDEGHNHIDIQGHYFIEDDHGGYIYIDLMVNWFNWFDDDADFEVDDADTGTTVEPGDNGYVYPPINADIWPPVTDYDFEKKI